MWVQLQKHGGVMFMFTPCLSCLGTPRPHVGHVGPPGLGPHLCHPTGAIADVHCLVQEQQGK